MADGRGGYLELPSTPSRYGNYFSISPLFLFSSAKSLFHFKRQVKQYKGSLEVSFLPYLPFLFCPSSARSQPRQYIPTTVPFPSLLCLKSPTRRSVNYLCRGRLQVGSVLTPREHLHVGSPFKSGASSRRHVQFNAACLQTPCKLSSPQRLHVLFKRHFFFHV